MLQKIIKKFKCSCTFHYFSGFGLTAHKDYIGVTQYIVNIKNCGEVASKR